MQSCHFHSGLLGNVKKHKAGFHFDILVEILVRLHLIFLLMFLVIFNIFPPQTLSMSVSVLTLTVVAYDRYVGESYKGSYLVIRGPSNKQHIIRG